MHPSPRLVTALLAAAVPCGATSAAALPFDDTGHLYVSMWNADEIAVFGEGGTPVTRFSADGLDGPRGLAFHPERDELWVAGEHSDALYVFDGEHRPLRTVRHPDFDEPVGITFSAPAAPDAERELYVSNSNGDEIMVFSEAGELLRRFTDPSLRDPNCSALLPDGTLFVANRLGGSEGPGGAVARFGANEGYEFDFTTEGIVSTMAVARDPNAFDDPLDDTLWVTSGAGTLGIHEFDVAGNLLRSVLPDDVPGGEALVPQGIAFADDGHFFVVSFRDAVFEFDGDGRFVTSFPTGPGTARSTAFRRCDGACAASGGSDASADPMTTTPPGEPTGGRSDGGGSGGGGLGMLVLCALAHARLGRRRSGKRRPPRAAALTAGRAT